MPSPQQLHDTIVAALREVSDYLAQHTTSVGVLHCQKHRTEHIGKTAYAIGIHGALYRATGEGQYRDRMLRLVPRLVAECVATDGVYTVRATSDPVWNMSSNVIDTGSVVDVMAELLQHHEADLSSDVVVKMRAVINDRCFQYLTEAVVAKAHTNQRLWGATGLANSYALTPTPAWRAAVLASVTKSEGEIRADGSIPYITDYAAKNHVAAVSDISCNYHSRHIAFMHYALSCTGALDDAHITKLRPTVDFLLALYGAPGKKVMALETKRWYYHTPYEVASNVFDVYALLAFYTVAHDGRYYAAAVDALTAVTEHMSSDRGLVEHPQYQANFLCQIVTTSHALWLARTLPLLEQLPAPAEAVSNAAVASVLKDAGLIHYKNDQYAVSIRTSSQPANAVWGAQVTGGSIVYFGRAEQAFADALTQSATYTWHHPWWQLRSVHHLISKRELAALLFHVRVAWRARSFRALWLRSQTVLRALVTVPRVYSATQYHQATVEQTDDQTVVITSGLANRAGAALPTIKVVRKYTFAPEWLQIEETLTAKTADTFTYTVPPQATAEAVTTDGTYTRRANELRFTNTTQAVVTYQL